jgi:IS1 family transposase
MSEERIAGDVWVWAAIDADTKLIPCWLLGKRDAGCATEFIQDLANRLANRVQLTTDGLRIYVNAVIDAFADDIDYAMLHKIYGVEPANEARYSRAKCIGCESQDVLGSPDPDHISTSYIERQNLTMRMSMRRFTRLTNAFSKKIENHSAAVALYMMYYNFGGKHLTLGTTPAVKAAIADHIWTAEEIIGILEATGTEIDQSSSFKLNHYHTSAGAMHASRFSCSSADLGRKWVRFAKSVNCRLHRTDPVISTVFAYLDSPVKSKRAKIFADACIESGREERCRWTTRTNLRSADSAGAASCEEPDSPRRGPVCSIMSRYSRKRLGIHLRRWVQGERRLSYISMESIIVSRWNREPRSRTPCGTIWA